MIIFMFMFELFAIFFVTNVSAASPTVTTNAATGVGTTNATLKGTITNIGGQSIYSFGFRYGLTTAYGTNRSLSTVGIYAGSGTGLDYRIRQYFADTLGKKNETESYGGTIVALCNDSTYIYTGGETTNKVYQYWKSNMTKKGETDSYGGTVYSIVSDETYIYVGGATAKVLRKYKVSDLSLVTSSPQYSTTITSVILDSSDPLYLYYGGSVKNTVKKAYRSDLTTVLTSDSYGTTIYEISQDTNNLYVAGGSAVGTVRKYLKSTMAFVSATAAYGETLFGLAVDSNYVYYGGGDTNTKVYRAWTSNMTKTSLEVEYGGTIESIIVDDTYMYVGGQSTDAVRKYWKSNFTLIAESPNNGVVRNIVKSDITYRVGDIIAYNATGLLPGRLYHYIVNATNVDGTGYGSDMTFLTKPDAPTGLYAQVNSSTRIYLTWIKGTGANNTIIQRKINSYPTSVTDGTNVYNGSSTHYENNGLVGGTAYYYRAWSYLNWSTLQQWSDNYISAFTLTNPNVTTDAATGIEETNATLRLTVTAAGGNPTTTGFDYGFTTAYGTTVGGFANISFFDAIGLLQGSFYHFRAFAINNNGSGYGTDKTFLTKPDAPTALNALTYSSTSISLTWTVGTGADRTVILRKTTGYPANQYDGVEVYNNTGNSYNNTGLTEAQIYYYRAWSFTTEGGLIQWSDSYSSDVDMTYPDAPTNTNITLLNSTHIGLTWTKGTGADYTVILRKTTGMPASYTDGTVVYNGTDAFYNDTFLPGVSSYYKAWSYSVDAPLDRYSLNGTIFTPTNGLAIEAFSEDDCSPLIGYSILVSNEDGSDVYVLTNITGGIGINASLCPQGLVSILVSCDGYRSRLYYLNIYEGIFYYLNAYLPSNSTAELYLLTIVGDRNEYGNSPPIDNVFVTVKTYINCTGIYETVSNVYTDAYGQCDIYLRSTLYKILLNRTGYENNSEDYIPDTSLRTRTFRLSFSEAYLTYLHYLFENIAYDVAPLGQIHHSAFTIWYNITSSDNQLQWFSLEVLKYGQNNHTWYQIYFSNLTNAGGGSIHYPVANISGRYAAEFRFKKIGYDEYKIVQLGSIQYSIIRLKEALQQVPDYPYFIAVLVIMALAMGFAMPYAGIGTGYIGLTIFAIALVMRPFTIDVGGDFVSGWWIFAVTFLIYSVGIFLWSRL